MPIMGTRLLIVVLAMGLFWISGRCIRNLILSWKRNKSGHILLADFMIMQGIGNIDRLESLHGKISNKGSWVLAPNSIKPGLYYWIHWVIECGTILLGCSAILATFWNGVSWTFLLIAGLLQGVKILSILLVGISHLRPTTVASNDSSDRVESS